MRKKGLPLSLAAAAAVLFVAALPVPGDESHSEHAATFDRCAKACNDCQRACDSCATHCANLVASGRKEHLKTLKTCQDCASFCATAAQIVARQGAFTDLICKSCAEACARCGKACEQHPDDKHMKMCAEQCRACEQACREMLKHVGETGEEK